MSSENKAFIAVHHTWISNNITKHLERIYDCYIVKVVKDYSFMKLLQEVRKIILSSIIKVLLGVHSGRKREKKIEERYWLLFI